MSELSLVLKATLLLVIALVAVRAARRAPAALRALILTCGLGAIVALPFVSLALAPRTLAVPLPGTEPQVVQFGHSALTPASIRKLLVADPAAPAPLAPLELPSPMNVLRALWAVGALVVAIRISLALLRISRIRRRGTVWPESATDVQSLLSDTSSSRAVRVFLHPALAAPMTCGLFRPVIGLPVDAPQWSVSDLRRALIHEMEHVRRADWLTQLLAEVACAVFWFHPLVWMASRRLRLECEHACDDAVVRRTGGTEYAQQLVALAKRLTANRAPVPLLSMAGSSNLSERVRAVLDQAHPRHPLQIATAAFTVGVAVAVALLVAPTQVVAQTATRESQSHSIPTSLGTRSFDTVSIRPVNGKGTGGLHISGTVTGRTEPGIDSSFNISMHSATLRLLIASAYAPESLFASPGWQDLPDERVIGGPDWIGTTEFTIDATFHLALTGRPRNELTRELQAMLRRMLHEHFNLVVHVESQWTPAYRLVRARSGGALGPGLRPVENCVGPFIRSSGLGEMSLRCVTMDALASPIHLWERLGRPIVDDTGMTGAFDLSLVYAPTPEELKTIYELDPENVSPDLASRPSIFDAVQAQLGLRLEPTQTPVQSLVVDWADRPTQTR